MRQPRPEPQPTGAVPPTRRWQVLIGGLVVALLAGTVAAATPSGTAGLPADSTDCALFWRVTARLDTVPRQLQVDLAFDAGGRSSSTLRLPGGWAEVSEASEVPAANDVPATTPRLLPVPGAPTLRRVQHGPNDRVALRWRLVPGMGSPQTGSVRLAAQWLAFSGQGVLALPIEIDDRAAPSACIALTGLAPGGRWRSSHGGADTPDAWLRLAAHTPSSASLAERVQQALFAGGALQTHAASAASTDGTPLSVVLAGDGPWRFDPPALHQAAALAITAQRRYWGAERDTGLPWLLLLMPTEAGQAGGTAWHRALALQASVELDLPGVGFDLLMSQALARAWVAERFGPLAHAGRGDQRLRAWFSEGLADFLGHRALLRQGLWTPQDYAATLNRRIAAYLDSTGPDAVPATDPLALPAAQGEWLALRWHAALLAAGRPGLEAQLQRLLLPADQARREGPTSAPLASHRLLAALRPVLGDAALADLRRHVEQGEGFDFGPATLGPCFVGRWQAMGRWQLGFDPASLKAGVLHGVVPGSAAETAGLRDGLRLRGHALAPGDASQPVWLRLQEGSAPAFELSYLPASPPLRDRPRYESLPQALQRPDCQAWLGPAAEARAPTRAEAKAKPRSKSKAVASRPKSPTKGKAPGPTRR